MLKGVFTTKARRLRRTEHEGKIEKVNRKTIFLFCGDFFTTEIKERTQRATEASSMRFRLKKRSEKQKMKN
jgi:hypothetical protein